MIRKTTRSLTIKKVYLNIILQWKIDIMRVMDDGVLLDKAKAANALRISFGDLLTALKLSQKFKSPDLEGFRGRVAKIPRVLPR